MGYEELSTLFYSVLLKGQIILLRGQSVCCHLNTDFLSCSLLISRAEWKCAHPPLSPLGYLLYIYQGVVHDCWHFLEPHNYFEVCIFFKCSIKTQTFINRPRDRSGESRKISRAFKINETLCFQLLCVCVFWMVCSSLIELINAAGEDKVGCGSLLCGSSYSNMIPPLV